jgi:hypothetical protein
MIWVIEYDAGVKKWGPSIMYGPAATKRLALASLANLVPAHRRLYRVCKYVRAEK